MNEMENIKFPVNCCYYFSYLKNVSLHSGNQIAFDISGNEIRSQPWKSTTLNIKTLINTHHCSWQNVLLQWKAIYSSDWNPIHLTKMSFFSQSISRWPKLIENWFCKLVWVSILIVDLMDHNRIVVDSCVSVDVIVLRDGFR